MGVKPIWPRGVGGVPVALPPGGRRHAVVSGSQFARGSACPCSGVFHATDFQTFSMLAVGFIARVRVTARSRGCCRAPGWPASGITAARTTSSRGGAGTPDELGLRLLDFLVSVFVGDRHADPPGRGRHAVRALREAACGARTTSTTAPSQRARAAHALGQLLGRGRARRIAAMPGRAAGRAARPVQPVSSPRTTSTPAAPSQPELARPLIDMVLTRFTGHSRGAGDGRRIRHQGLAGPPERVTVTTRMRSKRRACSSSRHHATGKRGRPRAEGRAPGSLARARRRSQSSRRSRSPGPTAAAASSIVRDHDLPVVRAVSHPPGHGDADPQARRTEGFDVAIASTDTDRQRRRADRAL